MNRNLIVVILLVFIAGIAAGFTLNKWVTGDAQSIPAIQSAVANGDQNSEKEMPSAVKQISSAELFDTVLPNMSPVWFQIDCRILKANAMRFQDVFQLKSIQSILTDFSSSLPNGATDTVNYIYDNADTIDLFLLPSEPNSQDYRFAAAYRVSKASGNGSSVHHLFSFWQELLPDSERKTEEINGTPFQVIHSTIGEWIGLQDENLVWVSNHLPAFTSLFANPPNGDSSKWVNPRIEVFKRFPDTAVAVYLNSAREGAAAMALPGMVPQILAQQGIQKAFFTYQLNAKGVRLSAHAPAGAFPHWVQNWQPLPDFPFTAEDPMGLMEIAFHTPVMNASGTIHTSAKPNMNPKKEEKPGEPLNYKMLSNPFVSGLFPPGSIAGLNVFGMYKGQPTLALRIVKNQLEPQWVHILNDHPSISKSEIEIDRIPATYYNLSGSPMASMFGRTDLVVLERDTVMYIFDSPITAKNYFGDINSDPAGKTRRTISLRNGLSSVEQNGQIKGVLTKDMLNQWLWMEINRYHSHSGLRNELQVLQEEIQPHITPIHFSAGVRDGEWFLDSHAETAGGHLIDMIILTSMLKSFVSAN